MVYGLIEKINFYVVFLENDVIFNSMVGGMVIGVDN